MYVPRYVRVYHDQWYLQYVRMYVQVYHYGPHLVEAESCDKTFKYTCTYVTEHVRSYVHVYIRTYVRMIMLCLEKGTEYHVCFGSHLREGVNAGNTHLHSRYRPHATASTARSCAGEHVVPWYMGTYQIRTMCGMSVLYTCAFCARLWFLVCRLFVLASASAMMHGLEYHGT
jgi:hypothetical protein